MGLFSALQRVSEFARNASDRARFGPVYVRLPTVFRGRNSAREMGLKLIELWKLYRAQNPGFDPLKCHYKGTDVRDALHWICVQLGYPDTWPDVLSSGETTLGDFAINLTSCDLLQNERNKHKYSAAMTALHQCFSELLPDQIGGLEKAKKDWIDYCKF